MIKILVACSMEEEEEEEEVGFVDCMYIVLCK
jgi:hypothetical protein